MCGESFMVARRMLSIISNSIRVSNNNKVRDAQRKLGSFEYIPNYEYDVLHTFMGLKKHLTKENKSNILSFVDAGCGIGNILVAALSTDIATRVTGLELFDEPFKIAENFLKSCHQISVIQQDILLYDRYHEHDIIYYYCPFSDNGLQVRLEEKIEDEMKKGAILMPFYKQGGSLMRDDRFEKIEGCNAFIKTKKTKRKESIILFTDKSSDEDWVNQYPQYNLKYGKQIGE